MVPSPPSPQITCGRSANFARRISARAGGVRREEGRVFGEGESRVVIDGFKEVQVPWGPSDYRFTAKDENVYAFMMHAPEDRRAVIRSFEGDTVAAVSLLGCGEVPFTQSFGVLTVELPENLPTEYTNCLRITLG